ncbi:apoptotic chromatin condensation inducer in the nucleus [Rhinophrynus dorsalis]
MDVTESSDTETILELGKREDQGCSDIEKIEDIENVSELEKQDNRLVMNVNESIVTVHDTEIDYQGPVNIKESVDTEIEKQKNKGPIVIKEPVDIEHTSVIEKPENHGSTVFKKPVDTKQSSEIENQKNQGPISFKKPVDNEQVSEIENQNNQCLRHIKEPVAIKHMSETEKQEDQGPMNLQQPVYVDHTSETDKQENPCPNDFNEPVDTEYASEIEEENESNMNVTGPVDIEHTLVREKQENQCPTEIKTCVDMKNTSEIEKKENQDPLDVKELVNIEHASELQRQENEYRMDVTESVDIEHTLELEKQGSDFKEPTKLQALGLSTEIRSPTKSLALKENTPFGNQETHESENNELSFTDQSEILRMKSEENLLAVESSVSSMQEPKIAESNSDQYSPQQEECVEEPPIITMNTLDEKENVVGASSTTVLMEGQTLSNKALEAPEEFTTTESVCLLEAPVKTTTSSPERNETTETVRVSHSEAQREEESMTKLRNIGGATPLDTATCDSLPIEEQKPEREVEVQKASQEEESEVFVRHLPRRRSSSSSSTSSSSSSTSSSSSSSSSSRSSCSSTERSSHSRHSSCSKSSSPERSSRMSRSSSLSSSKSRSSSCNSDKLAARSESPHLTQSSDLQPTRILSSPHQESSQPLPSSSPPPPHKVVRLQRDILPQCDAASVLGHVERRRLHEVLDVPAHQEHIKRIKLEPESEDQDQRNLILGEREVREEQRPGDDNVAPEREDVVMEAVESQAEGEPQEAAPPQSAVESCEGDDKKENTTPPRTFKRKISVISAAKGSNQPPPAPTTNSDCEGSHPARRRRWGASTATTQKKPSISISTESLKSLIPEIKEIKQEAVVDLHAEDTHISEDEGERNGDDNSHDKGLKICRTVTQVVPAEVQENGQEEEEKVMESAAEPEPDPVPMETEVVPPSEEEVKKPLPENPARAEVRVTMGDTLLRRSISQQKTGVSITIDDPVRTASQLPSPPRHKVSCIVHICNLVRPFTLGQLKELLSRTGTLIEDNFWIDKIKSHCYVTYSTVEEAVATRNSLHGVKWPQSNPKFLSVDFAEQDEVDFHKGLLVERPPEPKPEEPPHSHPHIPNLRGEHREHERGVREQWAEREREMERRERTRAEREWDRDKIREGPRSRSRDRRRKEHAKSKEKKNEKKERVQEEPPAKLLDDLFNKTKAAPCIYWLPLTDDQVLQKFADRAERAKEREKRRKEEEEQLEEERKERAKEREKETERNRDRTREADREKRREHSRDRPRERERREPKRHSRSRSRSTPVRDRGGRR